LIAANDGVGRHSFVPRLPTSSSLDAKVQAVSPWLSCSFQKRKRVCEQKRKDLEDRNMEEDHGFGFWMGAWRR
jgi:hypothetical protein